MSLTTALLMNAAILLVVLAGSTGTRAVTRRRLLRPLLAAAVVVAAYVHQVFTSGAGLAVELGALALGGLLGLAANGLVRVGHDARLGVVSRAGAGFAVLWTAVCALRVLFSWGAAHLFAQQLGTWMVLHGVAVADIAAVVTNGVVLMSMGMLVTCAAGLAVRGRAADRAVAGGTALPA